MGEEGYAELVLRCEAHLDTVKRARSAGARQLIPLLVHPATVAAGTVGGRRTRVPRKRTTAPVPGPTSRRTRWPSKAAKAPAKATHKAPTKSAKPPPSHPPRHPQSRQEGSRQDAPKASKPRRSS